MKTTPMNRQPSDNTGETARQNADCNGQTAADPSDAPRGKTGAIPGDLSRKLLVVSFISACCVVLLHAYENHMSDTASPVTAWPTTLFSRVMAPFAVPLFFAISGYLFAVKTNLGLQENWYVPLLKKRARTLLVPYLAWCTIYALTTIPFTLLGNHLAGRSLVHNTFLHKPLLSLWNLATIYGLDFTTMPAGGILWYIRNLLVLFLISPVFLFIMRRRISVIAYFLLAMAATVLHDWIPSPACWKFFETGFSITALIYFPLGIYFAFYPVKPDSFRIFRRLSPFLWLALSIVATWLFLYPGENTLPFERILLKVVVLVGVCAVWTLPDVIPAFLRIGEWRIAKDSFLVYLLHYGFLIIVMCAKVAEFLEIKLHVPTLGIYLLRFLVPLVLSLLTAEILKRFLPKLYRFLSGGR